MRDNLIELIVSFFGCDSMYYGVESAELADHLIENGVTIPQWIPVSERLPVPYETVLVVVNEKYNHEKHIGIHTDVGYYSGDHEGSIDREWDTFNDWDEGQQLLHISHWMPLPEPPQEDE